MYVLAAICELVCTLVFLEYSVAVYGQRKEAFDLGWWTIGLTILSWAILYAFSLFFVFIFACFTVLSILGSAAFLSSYGRRFRLHLAGLGMIAIPAGTLVSCYAYFHELRERKRSS